MTAGAINVSGFDRVLGWALPGIAAATPAIIYFPLYPNDQQAYFLILAMLLLGAALGAAWMIGLRGAPGRPDAFALLTLALGASASISVLHSARPLFSLDKLMLPLAALMFFAQIAMHPARRQVIARLTGTLIVVGALLAAYGIAQSFGRDFLKYGEAFEKNAVVATIGHPNYLGSVLGPLAFLALGAAVGGSRSAAARLGSALAAGLMIACIAVAKSRGVWLGLAAGTGWTLALTAARRIRACRRPLKMALAAGAVAIALGLAGLSALTNSARADAIGDRLLASNEVKSRLFYWRAAVDIGAAHPLFGVGPGMFDPNFWPYVLDQQKSPIGPYYRGLFPSIVNRTPDHAHNEYLEVFADHGFLGLLLLLAWLMRFVYFGSAAATLAKSDADARRLRCAEGALIVAMVDAFFGFPWRLPVSLIVFMLVAATLDDSIRGE